MPSHPRGQYNPTPKRYTLQTMIMHCIFLQAKWKNFKCFHWKQKRKFRGDRHVYPDLNTAQCKYGSKHHEYLINLYNFSLSVYQFQRLSQPGKIVFRQALSITFHCQCLSLVAPQPHKHPFPSSHRMGKGCFTQPVFSYLDFLLCRLPVMLSR